MKPTFIWASADNDYVNVNSATSLVEIVEEVMEIHHDDSEALEISLEDGQIKIVDSADDDTTELIGNNCWEVVEYLENYCADMETKFDIKELTT